MKSIKSEEKGRDDVRYKMTQLGFQAPSTVQNKEGSTINQGEIPYILSRLEFLEIRMNAWLGCAPAEDNCGVFYTARPHDNTIIISVYGVPSTPQKKIDYLIEFGREALLSELKALGWDWVKIQESMKVARE